MATIEPRDFTITGQWAKSAQTTIPPIPATGVAYRMSNMTTNRAQEGTPFNQIWDSASNNQKDFETSGISKMAETYGFIPWSPLTNYVGGASWCLGTNGTPYHAIANSGVGTPAGSKPPPNAAYWQSLADYVAANGSGGTIIGMCIPFTGTFSGKNPIDVSKGTPLLNWHICDGTDGTPDLRDKFIVGSSPTKPASAVGGTENHAHTAGAAAVGATTLTIDQLALHNHIMPWKTFPSIADGGGGVQVAYADTTTNTYNTGGNVPHTHAAGAVTVNANTNLPPYYAMAWIIRTA